MSLLIDNKIILSRALHKQRWILTPEPLYGDVVEHPHMQGL
jgi:hypothetical protein